MPSSEPEVAHPTPPARPAAVGWGMGDAAAGIGVIVVASIVAGAVAQGVFGRRPDDDPELWQVAVLQVPLWTGLLGVPLWAARRKGSASLVTDFGLAMRPADVPLGLVAGVAAQYVLGLALTVVYDLLGVDVEQVGESARALTDAADDWVGVVLLVLVTVVAAPLFEELFYRGLWLRAAERRLGARAAVVVSGLVFATMHGQWYDLPALLGVGFLFGFLTVRSGRLGPAIWAHVGFNAIAVVNLLA